MGKRWIVLLAVALVGLMARAVYADKFMVVVIQVEDGNVEKVYGADTQDLDDSMKLQTTGPASEQDVNKKTMKIKKKNGEEKDAKVVKMPNNSVILTQSSPGCVTYTYGNYSWTVCNP